MVDRGRGRGEKRAEWEGSGLRELTASPSQPAAAVTAAEVWTHDVFPRCLAAARFVRKPGPRSDALTPAAVEGWLDGLRETDQFAAVRLLHVEMRVKGESDALVAWAGLSPDAVAYEVLAAARKAEGREDRWLAALEAALEQEDAGLDHARVRIELAEHVMARKDFRRAEPYAMAAAESYSGSGLLCAARCKEGLGKWDEANALYRAMAERYPDHAAYWYFAYVASGRMDRAAAERAFLADLAEHGGGVPPGLGFFVGRYHLIGGRVREALAEFDRSDAASRSPLGGLFTALAADEVGDAAARRRAIDRLVTLGLPGPPVEGLGVDFVEVLRGWVTGPGVPTEAAVEAALARLRPEHRADFDLFVGWFLANRGHTGRAVAHWERCARTMAGTRLVKTHATVFLATRGPARKWYLPLPYGF